MPIKLNEDRKYQRYKYTEAEKEFIRSKGFTPVLSSNVSAIARDGDTLYIRFHRGGATYSYPTSGDLFDKMLASPSKGHFVWEYLIWKHVPYKRESLKVFKTGFVSEREAPIDLMKQSLIENAAMATEMLSNYVLPTMASLALASVITPLEAEENGITVSTILAMNINGNATYAENSRQT